MCGRFTLLADESDIQSAFQLTHRIKGYKPSYNIAPGQEVLVIIHDGKQKRAGYLRWGLVPSWAKDEKIGYKMINARSETAHEKPSFKQLMARKRCLIVADSFYEWKQVDGVKQPQRIQVANRSLFAFAGLWDKWQQDNRTLFTCTILTKDANDFMKDIHHRMPIILPKAKEDEWITPYVQSPIRAKQFLEEIIDEKFTAYPVDTYVNKAQNNDETCIKPI
ncbi:MAG TPA: SOS response-associated peptidase [Pseudogracilibacillus sp.]|nr:SOS response-associated peptidase [Pseudogracilibacillus sp.]